MFDYAGAVHVHSDYSFDGHAGIGAIVAAAKRTGLDFIVVTDHGTLEARRRGWEGWHDGVLVVVGEEISPRYNHCLALGIDREVHAAEGDAPQRYIDAVNRQGGLALIAHPDHTGAPLFDVKDYRWRDWEVDGYAGLSVWDLMTDWQEKLTSYPAALMAYLFPARSLTGPKKETLARWDVLNSMRPVAGYGEVDNHDSRKRVFGREFRIFPFETAFRTIRTHVLLDGPLSADGVTACRQVCEAFRACRLYAAHEWRHAAKGFSFTASGRNGSAGIGGEYRLGGGPCTLEVRLPSPGTVRLVRDGEPVARAKARDGFQRDIDREGVYRVEVYHRGTGREAPWIFSNHIRVRS